jgi:DNA (cytosine-5)-methyltransferase 1
MGFPDNYTSVNGNSDTNRFQAIGNSWAVPVVKWIGNQIDNFLKQKTNQEVTCWYKSARKTTNNLSADLYLLDNVISINQKLYLNSSTVPNTPIESTIEDIVQVDNVPEKFYLSPQACRGILRRKQERDLKMNSQLETLMTIIGQQERTLQEA